jgi:hypothetical protein
MARNFIIRESCADRDAWLKLLKNTNENAIDPCIDVYTADEVKDIDSLLKGQKRVLIANSTPILYPALLIVGRGLVLYKHLNKLSISIQLNQSAIPTLVTYIHSNDFEKLLEESIKNLVRARAPDIEMNYIFKTAEESQIAIEFHGRIELGKKRSLNMAISIDKVDNKEYLYTLIEVVKLYENELKGFTTILDLGTIEGFYTTALAELINKQVITFKKVKAG